MTQPLDIDTRQFPTFREYLDSRGSARRERVIVRAEKMAIAKQISEQMQLQQLTKSEMAERMGTSRAQLDRVLDPNAQNVTIDTLARAAQALGRRLHLELL